MRNICFICSAALIVLGAVGYFAWEAIGAENQSVTAAIPAFVGILMLIGGLVALKNNMAGMHIAVLFAALGALGGLAGLGRLVPSLIKGNLAGPAPVLIGLMTLICVVFVVLAVRSFIAARKARG